MLEQLSDIVTSVGREILAWRGSQFKTEADLRAHAALSLQLERRFPDIPIISEEDAASQSPARPPRYWLIDPIDGTASFSEGYAGYVTQIALIENHQPQLGAIYAPALDLLYLAQRDKSATLNGRPLKIARNARGRVLIDNTPEPRGAAKVVFERLRCTGYVESGSIALKICRIADGTADLFVKDIPVRDWDIAPAHLVIGEAGGVLAGLHGATEIAYSGSYEHSGIVAATSAELVAEVRAALVGDAAAP